MPDGQTDIDHSGATGDASDAPRSLGDIVAQTSTADAAPDAALTDVDAAEDQTEPETTGEDTGDVEELDFGEAPPEGTPERAEYDKWKAVLTQRSQEQAARRRELDEREQQLREQFGDDDAQAAIAALRELDQEAPGAAQRLLGADEDAGADQSAQLDYMSRQMFGLPFNEMSEEGQAMARYLMTVEARQAAQSTQQLDRQLDERFNYWKQQIPSLDQKATVTQLRRLVADMRLTPQQITPRLMDLAVQAQIAERAGQQDQRKRQRANEIKASTAAKRSSAGGSQVPADGGTSMWDIYAAECRAKGINPEAD